MKEIVNVSQNWAIGKEGNLMVRIPEDMKHFRELTKGKVCIMGSKTLNSFPDGYPLKNRVNIVLTSHKPEEFGNALKGLQIDVQQGRNTKLIFVHSKKEALKEIEKYSTDDVYVIGGASIYRLFLDDCDCCIVTHNSLPDEGADTYYPDLSAQGWTMIKESEEYEYEGIRYRFCEYRKTDKTAIV